MTTLGQYLFVLYNKALNILFKCNLTWKETVERLERRVMRA